MNSAILIHSAACVLRVFLARVMDSHGARRLRVDECHRGIVIVRIRYKALFLQKSSRHILYNPHDMLRVMFDCLGQSVRDTARFPHDTGHPGVFCRSLVLRGILVFARVAGSTANHRHVLLISELNRFCKAYEVARTDRDKNGFAFGSRNRLNAAGRGLLCLHR